MKFLPLPLLIGLLALESCSLDERLAATASSLEQQYAQLETWEQLPERTISWNQALAMMKRNNTEFLQAQKTIERSNRNEISVYTDLIPGVSYYAYMNKALGDMARSIDSNEISQNLNVSFYLPSLTQLPYRVYASKATTFAAIKAQEGKERELISKLFTQQRKQDIERRKQALESRKPQEQQQYYQSLKKDNNNAQWSEIASLLGDYSARWRILPSSVPRFQWSRYRELTRTLDPLVFCQLAMELEQARLRQYQVAITYLPTINMNLYSPSLFSSSGGTYSGTFLDKDDTKLNLSLSYTFDTQLRTWNTYKDSKDDYERKQREVAIKLMEYKQKLHLLRSSMDEYTAWRSYMHKQKEHLKAAPAANAEEFLHKEDSIFAIEQELLNQELASVESEAALILQYGLR